MLASKSVLRFHELIQMRKNVIVFQLAQLLLKRSQLPTILSAVAMGLLVFGCKEKPRPTPPLKVQVVTVTPQDVPIYQQWIGTLDGYPNAQIRAQVSGYLIKQDYLEGSEIKKGDLLFEVDPRPFQAALDQALVNWPRTRRRWQDGVGRQTLRAAGQRAGHKPRRIRRRHPGEPHGSGGRPIRQGRRGKRHAEP